MNQVRNRPSFFKQQIVVDKKVQFAVLMYSALFGVLSFIAGCTFVTAYQGVSAGAQSEDQAWMVGLLCAAWLVGFFLLIVVGLLFSHRIAGPIYRLRSHMQQLSEGKVVEPLRFREGDHFQDLASDYNALVDNLRPSNSQSN